MLFQDLKSFSKYWDVVSFMLEPNIKWRGLTSKYVWVCFLVSCDPRSERRVMESSVFCHPSVLKWIPSLNVPTTSIMNWKGSFLLTFLLCVKMSSQDQELKDQVCFFICKAVKLMEQNIKWVVKLYNNKLVTTMTHTLTTKPHRSRRRFRRNGKGIGIKQCDK